MSYHEFDFHGAHMPDCQACRIAALETALAEARRDTERLDAMLSHPWAIGKCDLRFHPKEYCVIETAWINSSDSEEKAIAYGDTARDAIDAALAKLQAVRP